MLTVYVFMFGIGSLLYRPAVENQKIKCNEPMGYTPISLERGMPGLSE